MLHPLHPLQPRPRTWPSRIPAAAALTGILALPLLLLGCQAAPPPANSSVPATPAKAAATTPPRPTVPPPPFKLFHSAEGSFTLVTRLDASDEQIEAILWQLRDAARTQTLTRLHINQRDVDAHSPDWFHVYRGPKCAPEKYADGPLPCGGGYHAAGDYTYGGPKNPHWDTGALLHGDDARDIQLWDPDAAYTPPSPSSL